MKIFSSLLLLAITSAVSLSCQKEDTPAAATKTDHLTAAPWTHESSGIDSDKNGSIDIPLALLGTIPPCRLDNLLTFKKDNTATADEGATKCNDADPQSTSFNWSFADNETSLNISGNVLAALNGKSTIKEISATRLTLSKDTTLPAPIGTVAIVVNMKH